MALRQAGIDLAAWPRVGAAAGALSCASSVTSMSNNWLWCSGLASVAANRLPSASRRPSELNSTSGSV